MDTQQTELKSLINRCIIDAFNHINEGSASALNQAVQETNQALCSLFAHHLSSVEVQPATDHDKLVTQMRRNADPVLESDLAKYLYKAHEELRAQAYHTLAFPAYYDTLEYFCVAEAICSIYGFPFPYSKIKSLRATYPSSKLLRLLPVDEVAYAYVDYEHAAIRHQIASKLISDDIVFYYPTTWKWRSNTDCEAVAFSPTLLGNLSFWIVQKQKPNTATQAISPDWALNLVRKRWPSFEVSIDESERCYVGESKGVMLTLDVFRRIDGTRQRVQQHGLYLAIGSQPSIEILFLARPIAFGFLFSLVRACLFSSHRSFRENGKLVRGIVNSLDDAIHRKKEYRHYVVKSMWKEQWYYFGDFPRFFIPDFGVFDGDYSIGWGVILTQPSGLELVIERWARVMKTRGDILFLVIPNNLTQRARSLCNDFDVIHRGIMGYGEYGSVDRPRR